jgi:streptogramin lyase
VRTHQPCSLRSDEACRRQWTFIADVAPFFTIDIRLTWNQIPGILHKVAVGAADKISGISQTGHVVVWDPASNSFSSAAAGGPVMLSLAGAADGTLYGISLDKTLIRLDPVTGRGAFLPGTLGNQKLDQISVGGSRLIWGVYQGKVYRHNPDTTTWTEVPAPEPFSQVTVSSDGEVCGVANSNKIYTFNTR